MEDVEDAWRPNRREADYAFWGRNKYVAKCLFLVRDQWSPLSLSASTLSSISHTVLSLSLLFSLFLLWPFFSENVGKMTTKEKREREEQKEPLAERERREERREEREKQKQRLLLLLLLQRQQQLQQRQQQQLKKGTKEKRKATESSWAKGMLLLLLLLLLFLPLAPKERGKLLNVTREKERERYKIGHLAHKGRGRIRNKSRE